MGLSSKIPLVVIEPGCSIMLEGKVLDDMVENPRPILWNREGLYGWVSITQMRNTIRTAKDAIKIAKNNHLTVSHIIRMKWDVITPTAEAPAQAIEEMSKLLEKKL